MGSVSAIRRPSRLTVGTIHVRQSAPDQEWQVCHEGRHGNSWGAVETFPANDLASAFVSAMAMMASFGPCDVQIDGWRHGG